MQPEKQIVQFVKREMIDSGEAAHSYDHVKRVFALSMELGKSTDANLRILGTAALLHDIGRARESELGVSHSILSGEMSKDILLENGYSDSEIGDIVAVIRTHRFSEGLTPTSLEGEILSDADKLDAMGAIGVFRAIDRAVATGAGIEGFLRHADEKLLKLRELMYTDAARSMAEKRHGVLESFVNQLREELNQSDFFNNNSR